MIAAAVALAAVSPSLWVSVASSVLLLAYAVWDARTARAARGTAVRG